MFLCVHPARLSPRPSVSVGGVAVGNFHETIDIAKPCLHSILVGIQCTQVRINKFELVLCWLSIILELGVHPCSVPSHSGHMTRSITILFPFFIEYSNWFH